MKKSVIVTILLSSPSGGGKNTLIDAMLELFPELEHSISTTTRLPRNKEKHGKEYYFTTINQFKKAIVAGKFIEYAKVLDNYYGTTKDEINRIRAHKRIPILDLDVKGTLKLKELISTKKSDELGELICIFIDPPGIDELEKRLRNRGTESDKQIHERIKLAHWEISQKFHYDYIILNKKIDQATQELAKLLTALIKSND